MKTYSVYILTNHANTVLYIGVTSNLAGRVWQHRNELVDGFTKRYHLHKLVYFESTEDVYAAIAREKQLKAGSRKKKLDLITAMNPDWNDLYESICS